MMLAASALSAADLRPLRETVACSWTRTGQGAAGWWEGNPEDQIPHTLPDALPEALTDALPDMPTADRWALNPEVERAQGDSPSSEVRIAGGSERLLTLATGRGVVALDTRDGSPL